MHFCTHCGARLGSGRFCGQCGAPTEQPAASSWTASRTAGGRDEAAGESAFRNINESHLGALAYLTPIPALAFLLFEPMSASRFVRFHSYQCLFLSFLAVVLAALTGIVSIFAILGGILSAALEIVLFALWCLAAYHAWHGQEFHLPLLGSLAAHYASPRGQHRPD